MISENRSRTTLNFVHDVDTKVSRDFESSINQYFIIRNRFVPIFKALLDKLLDGVNEQDAMPDPVHARALFNGVLTLFHRRFG